MEKSARGGQGHLMDSEQSSIDEMIESNKNLKPVDLGRGQYYVAPDSAEPLPDTLWEGLDLGDLESVVQEFNERLRSNLEVREGGTLTTTAEATFYVSDEERQTLSDVGGPALEALLEDFRKATQDG
jgi:hypothetical protein